MPTAGTKASLSIADLGLIIPLKKDDPEFARIGKIL